MESDYEKLKGSSKRGYKSKGEVQIARLLERNGIAYQYEHPLAVVDQGKTRIWYPDFSLPEYGMIIEYFGINGDSGYDERTKRKMEVYEKNGIGGVFLKKDSLAGDWPSRTMGQIESILKERIDKFYNRRCSSKSKYMARQRK